MARKYVLKTEYTRRHAKTGEPYKDVSFYVGNFYGIAHEWSGRPQDARVFPSRALAEVYARNKGIRYHKVAQLPT